MKIKKISAIICAGGSGERAKLGKNKLLADLYGAPVLWHTLKKFDIPEIDEVVIASSKIDLAEISAIAAPFGCKIVLG
ncbi:MAG: 2-C-methyl-D-erythritol 4-phosphate cytidylyltransferase, partial [Clostridia bacterium]|nr:2-C-methyl-D-erythritol 4-phosphate cytidylyltransferase [Clostridia bacterium]